MRDYSAVSSDRDRILLGSCSEMIRRGSFQPSASYQREVGLKGAVEFNDSGSSRGKEFAIAARGVLQRRGRGKRAGPQEL